MAFTDASTGSPTAWSWDFETDGVPDSTAQNPSHTYATAGTYTVTLTVTGSGGATSTATATVTVTDPTPVANADSYTTAEDQPLVEPAISGVLANDDDVTAATTATVAAGPSHGTLDLNADGSFTYTPAANFFGTDTFTYTAATGSQASAAATVTIEVTGVNDPPTADFTFSPASPTVVDPVAFTDGSSDPDGSITAWSWDFDGDGVADSTEQNPGHTYAAAGTYTVTLTATDNDGATATATDTVAVTLPPAPIVDAGGPYSGQEGSAVTLSASVSTSAPVTKYEWDFDGDLSFDHRTTATPSTEYTWGDVYAGVMGVRATDVYGRQCTDTTTVAIANVAPAVSGVTVPANPAAVGATVSASASFTHPGSGVTTATWAWGDGATTTGTIGAGSVAGTHAYAAPGVYQVAVTVADDDGGAGTAEARRLRRGLRPERRVRDRRRLDRLARRRVHGRPGDDRQGELRLRLEVPEGRDRPDRPDPVRVPGRRLRVPFHDLRLARDRRDEGAVQGQRHRQRRGRLRLHADGDRRKPGPLPAQGLGEGDGRDRLRQPAEAPMTPRSRRRLSAADRSSSTRSEPLPFFVTTATAGSTSPASSGSSTTSDPFSTRTATVPDRCPGRPWPPAREGARTRIISKTISNERRE